MAAKENLELRSREEEERRAEELRRQQAEVEALRLDKGKITEDLSHWEALRVDYNVRHQQFLSIPQFLQLVRSLLFPPPSNRNSAPSTASPLPPLPSLPSSSLSIAAASVSTFKAPPILPAGSSTPTASVLPPSAVLRPGFSRSPQLCRRSVNAIRWTAGSRASMRRWCRPHCPTPQGLPLHCLPPRHW